MSAASQSIFPDRDKAPSAPMPLTGASLLLAVLFVLCLAGLSVLSLSTAKTNSDRSLLLQEHRDTWYDACDRAQEIAAEIDHRLEHSEQSGTAADLSDLAISQIEDRICYQVPVNERQELRVELQLTPNSREYFTVVIWQLADRSLRQETELQLMNLTGGNE